MSILRVFAMLVALVWTSVALACPYCAGNTQGEKDGMTTLVLGAFILACYVPYAIIWRLIKQGQKMRELPPT